MQTAAIAEKNKIQHTSAKQESKHIKFSRHTDIGVHICRFSLFSLLFTASKSRAIKYFKTSMSCVILFFFFGLRPHACVFSLSFFCSFLKSRNAIERVNNAQTRAHTGRQKLIFWSWRAAAAACAFFLRFHSFAENCFRFKKNRRSADIIFLMRKEYRGEPCVCNDAMFKETTVAAVAAAAETAGTISR